MRSLRRIGFPSGLFWLVMSVVVVFWFLSLFGIAVALADKTSLWWVALVVGSVAPPAVILAIAALLRSAHQPNESRDATRTARGGDQPPRGALDPPQLELNPGSVSPEGLSDREREVLQLLAEGKTNRQIAEHLHLATGTVKAHLNSIFRKLDAANRTEAVARARALGLLRVVGSG